MSRKLLDFMLMLTLIMGLSFTLALGLISTPFASGMDSGKIAKKTLKIGITQYPSTLHPMIDSMLAKTYINALRLRPLTIHDPDWTPVCMLCTELPSFDNGRVEHVTLEDGTRTVKARYTLHPDATWGDGTPVTSDDVLFSWQVGRHEQTGVSNFELYARDIIAIDKIDDKNFAITFDKESCDFAIISDFNILPAHIERQAFEADPARYRKTTLYDADPTRTGLGYGPYKISKVRPGQGFTLVRNPTWWGKRPVFDEIRIVVIENSGALTAQLLAGQIDMIAGELGLTLDQALAFEDRLERQRPGQYQILYKSGLVYEHIDINHDNPALQDRKTRQALLYGINRKGISEQLFDGRQPVAHSNINPLDQVYSETVKHYPYNPDKAGQLLDEAGWILKDDGFRYNADGEKLNLTQITTAGNKTREMIQQAIQSDWKKIGVDSSIQNQAPRVLFGQTTRERKFKDTTMYAWMSAPQSIPRTTLHSSMIPNADNNYAGQNYPGYQNKKMDRILDDLETVCAPKANLALWQELQDLYASDLPALPLFFRSESHIIPTWLENIRPTGHQYPTTYWIEDWRVTP
jgi:peptide/nickel transport system substrate-binding protein